MPVTSPSSSTLPHPPRPPRPPRPLPGSVLIIGSGVFGLSTAWALTRRDAFRETAITVVDRSTDPDVFPSRDAASVDASRIIRADYSDPFYAALADEALAEWRKQGPDDLGGEGRYTESGLVLVADEPTAAAPAAPGQAAKMTGMGYVKSSWANVAALAVDRPELRGQPCVLPTADAIRDAVGTGGSSGSWGYLNRASGWADADASMRWLLARVRATGRVRFVNGTVVSLRHDGDRVTGAVLDDGAALSADLTILSAGAWSGSLVDLAGHAVATGQVLGYLTLTDEEQAQLQGMPVLLNLSTGLFIIPPRGRELKVARHAYGYLNPTTSLLPLRASAMADGPEPLVSVPLTAATRPDLVIPSEGSEALRSALREMIPIPGLRPALLAHPVVLVLGHPDGRLPRRPPPDAGGAVRRHGRQRPRLQVPPRAGRQDRRLRRGSVPSPVPGQVVLETRRPRYGLERSRDGRRQPRRAAGSSARRRATQVTPDMREARADVCWMVLVYLPV